MKIFISWSGQRAGRIATAFRTWFKDTLQVLDPFLSSEDTLHGQRWEEIVGKNLEASQYGVLIITPENKDARWILFEAGALSKSMEVARVVPILFEMDFSDLEPPLTKFQGYRFSKDRLFKTLQEINTLTPSPLDFETLKRAFDRTWVDLDRDTAEAIRAEIQTPVTKRSAEQYLDEILDIVRGMARMRDEEVTISEENALRTLVQRRLDARLAPSDLLSNSHHMEILLHMTDEFSDDIQISAIKIVEAINNAGVKIEDYRIIVNEILISAFGFVTMDLPRRLEGILKPMGVKEVKMQTKMSALADAIALDRLRQR